MKKLISTLSFLFCIVFLGATQVNPNSTYVKGYTKSNGTVVKGHYRTVPNNTINDNYTTRPNVNPYTGKPGTIAPNYSTPTYTLPSSYYSSPTYTYPKYKSTYTLPSYFK